MTARTRCGGNASSRRNPDGVVTGASEAFIAPRRHRRLLALSQHFKALREAGLIRSERHGVEMRNVLRCEEMNARFPGLLPAIIEAHQRQARSRAPAD